MAGISKNVEGVKPCKTALFRNDAIYYKEIGDADFKTAPVEYGYYTKTNQKTEWVDVEGNCLEYKTTDTKDFLDKLRTIGTFPMCESDLTEVQRFLHNRYDFLDDKAKTSDYRIAYFDIETQTGRKYPLATKITTENHGQLIALEIEMIDKTMNVFDIEANEWKPYNESCYYVVEFPEPSDAKYPINLITVYSNITNTTYTWGLFKYKGDKIPNYVYIEDEYEMAKHFVKWFHDQKFDIITGYNSETFDIPYICNRFRNICLERGVDEHNLTKHLSPFNSKPRIKTVRDDFGLEQTTYEFDGLYHIDMLKLVKKYGGINDIPSWKLDVVCKEILGVGKLEYEGSIIDIYMKDPDTYAEYNVIDVVRTYQLDEKLKLFDNIINLSNECLIPLNKYDSQVNVCEGAALKYSHREGIIIWDRKSKPSVDLYKQEGWYKVILNNGKIEWQNCEDGQETFPDFKVKAGWCDAVPGRYDHVMSADITSSYPHHIRMYNISPECKVVNPTEIDIKTRNLIKSKINNIYFTRDREGVVPMVSRIFFAKRKEFKKLMKKAGEEGNLEMVQIYNASQLSMKLLINSIYGCCLNNYSRFFDIDCARAITRAARCTIRYLKRSTDTFYQSSVMLEHMNTYLPTICLDDKYYTASEMIKVRMDGDSTETEFEIEAKEFDTNSHILNAGIKTVNIDGYSFNPDDEITIYDNSEKEEKKREKVILAKDFDINNHLLGIDEESGKPIIV